MTPGLTTQFCGELAELNRESLPAALVSAARPGLRNVVRQKALDLASRKLGSRGATELVDHCLGLDGQTTLDLLFDAATPQEAALG